MARPSRLSNPWECTHVSFSHIVERILANNSSRDNFPLSALSRPSRVFERTEKKSASHHTAPRTIKHGVVADSRLLDEEKFVAGFEEVVIKGREHPEISDHAGAAALWDHHGGVAWPSKCDGRLSSPIAKPRALTPE